MTHFVVMFEGVDLTDEQSAHVQSAHVQSALLSCAVPGVFSSEARTDFPVLFERFQADG